MTSVVANKEAVQSAPACLDPYAGASRIRSAGSAFAISAGRGGKRQPRVRHPVKTVHSSLEIAPELVHNSDRRSRPIQINA